MKKTCTNRQRLYFVLLLCSFLQGGLIYGNTLYASSRVETNRLATLFVNPQQFTATTSNIRAPTCGFDTPSYTDNGSFTVAVTDGSACAGTYTVNAAPVANSAPDGSTPTFTNTTTYIGFPQGNFFFGNAGIGQYTVTVTQTSGGCDLVKNPVVFTVTVPDDPSAGTCAIPNPQQFTAEASSIISPTCALESPGYANNGAFTIAVTDGSACAGTYTVNATPIAGSAPDGSTPPPTTVTTYIGFPQGDFFFSNAGAGQYTITVTQTGGGCNPVKNPLVFIVTVPDGATGGACDTPNPQQFTAEASSIISPTCALESPGYANNGAFTIAVTDGSACAGTYTVNATPIAGSAPDGSTPPPTTVTTYIGFPQGDFFFSNAGAGQYTVTVTQTGGGCNPVKNPLVFVVTIPAGPMVAIGNDQMVCSTKIPNSLTTTTLSVSSAATVTYQWEASTTDCVRDFVPIPDATMTTLTFTAPLAQTTYFRLRVTSVRDDISCDLFSNCVVLTLQKVDCGAFPWNGN